MVHACRWLLPIDRPPIEHAWFEETGGRIARFGRGAPPAPAVDLGDVAVLPGLVNAHTHLELSWMAGRVRPAASMDAWITAMLRERRAGPSADDATHAAARAAAAMRDTGTVLVGDISNSLLTPTILADAGLGGVVFHELIGFNVAEPAALVREALGRVSAARDVVAHAPRTIEVTVAAHAPYSVSPALFREIARRVPRGPLAIHLGESPEEIEFLREGEGPIRRLLDTLDVWHHGWTVPRTGPVDYLASLDYLRPGLLAAHGVHLTDAELDRLRRAGATVVTCPRSNLWVGAGMPRVSHFYASGVPVAIGTDSLASVASLNLFDELAELRRIAPDVAAASLLASATKVGAEALGFGETYGTVTPGKAAAFAVVDVPAGVTDVEEYLVSGVPSSAVHSLS